MSKPYPARARTLGLFEKRIPGDDCLLELARRRFQEARMGAEFHAATTDQLEEAFKFLPWAEAPVTVHLPRHFNLIEEQTCKTVLEFAKRFSGRVYGMVIHDHETMAARRDEYIAAAWSLDNQLETIHHSPILFVEYAAGLEPADFTRFFSGIPDLERISACIDIGHVGIRAARVAYALKHSREDVCSLKSQGPRLRAVIADVEQAVASGPLVVRDLVEALSKLKKPVHFHLHDGHPLSTFSPFGVSDHLSFDMEIPLSFEHAGRRALPLMFGPAGLGNLMTQTLNALEPRLLSFTLEIHPTSQRLPLDDAAPLFEHWTDKTNAEQMNHWLAVLSRNHSLLQQAIEAAITQKPE